MAKKKKSSDGPPVGPIIGAIVGGLLLVVGLVVGVWALTREGPPPPRPAAVAPTPASPGAAPTPPTPKKPPTPDEYYQWLTGGVWTRTADDKVLGGKRTVSLTFLPDRALVIKQSVPNPLAGLAEGAGANVDQAVTVGVTDVKVVAEGKELLIKTDEKGLLGVAPFARFKLRFEPDGKAIRLTEPGDESRWQDSPFTRGG